jgi:hypothetical protein
MDWSTAGCSAPVPGNGPYDFFARQPCRPLSGVHENAVRAFGGGFPTQGAYFYSPSW